MATTANGTSSGSSPAAKNTKGNTTAAVAAATSPAVTAAATHEGVPAAASRRTSLRWLGWLIGLVVVLLVLGAGIYWLTRSGLLPPPRKPLRYVCGSPTFDGFQLLGTNNLPRHTASDAECAVGCEGWFGWSRDGLSGQCWCVNQPLGIRKSGSTTAYPSLFFNSGLLLPPPPPGLATTFETPPKCGPIAVMPQQHIFGRYINESKATSDTECAAHCRTVGTPFWSRQVSSGKCYCNTNGPWKGLSRPALKYDTDWNSGSTYTSRIQV